MSRITAPECTKHLQSQSLAILQSQAASAENPQGETRRGRSIAEINRTRERFCNHDRESQPTAKEQSLAIAQGRIDICGRHRGKSRDLAVHSELHLLQERCATEIVL